MSYGGGECDGGLRSPRWRGTSRDYINRVAYRGERFLLTRGNRVVAEIRPVPEARKLSELPGLLETIPRLGEKEAETFARDWASSRQGLGAPDSGDPWES